jgi:hypothetical protein
VLIDQLQLELWEHQAKRLLGESESSASILLEVVSDLKPRSNATQGQEPKHGRPLEQAGPTPDETGIVLLEFLSHRLLRPASQWLNQGYQEPQSSSSSYRSHGQYHQQPYYRANPRTYHVEYVPGHTVPRTRWIQTYNGDWLDLFPQTPEQSIYFHEPRNQRRRNELDLYGYPIVSAPNYGQTAIACSFDFCLRTHTIHSRTQAERFFCKK